LFPFEFTVFGSPISLQTNNRALLQSWKAKVRQTALSHLPTDAIPTREPVIVEIVYYYKSAPLDIDDIAKPILDALNLLVYIDKRQITDLIISKRLLYPSSDKDKFLPAIALALTQNQPLIFVKVEIYSI